jgi:hypothetical protein
MADQKLTALTEVSAPSLDDLLYLVDAPAGTPASHKITLERLLGFALRGTACGRLTTEPGVAVSTSDRAAQGTLYFTPYNGNMVALHDGTRWKLHTFAEVSLALSALTADRNYDVFLYNNAGTPTLELGAEWTSDTSRSETLTTQDGLLVKGGATTRRYLGTIRSTGTTTTEDSGGGSTSQAGGKRYVWNAYNRVRRPLAVFDGTANWTYSTAAWRQANSVSANKVEFVCGLAAECLDVQVAGCVNTSAANARVVAAGVGLDSTTVNSATFWGQHVDGTPTQQVTASWTGTPAEGYHYLAWLELGGGADTQTWIGTAADGARRAGLVATLWA